MTSGSVNRGPTWLRQRLTNAPMYHVTTDNQTLCNVLGNKQDKPSYRTEYSAIL